MEAPARKRMRVTPLALTEDLWVLGNYFFNLYLVRGRNGSALIEAGISAIADRVIGQMEALDISPNYLIITHPHADHVTGLGALRERYPDAVVVAGMGTKYGRPPIEKFEFPENHIAVKDEHAIDLGGISLQCIKVGGHSPGNIVIHIPAMGALMISDSLGFHFPGQEFLPLFLTDFSDYINAIDYMASLKPDILGFGHQGPLIGSSAKHAFRESRHATFDMLSRVMDEEKKGDELAEEIFREYYRDEFTVYSEENIRSVGQLLVRRGRETFITRRITQ